MSMAKASFSAAFHALALVVGLRFASCAGRVSLRRRPEWVHTYEPNTQPLGCGHRGVETTDWQGSMVRWMRTFFRPAITASADFRCRDAVCGAGGRWLHRAILGPLLESL